MKYFKINALFTILAIQSLSMQIIAQEAKKSEKK